MDTVVRDEKRIETWQVSCMRDKENKKMIDVLSNKYFKVIGALVF